MQEQALLQLKLHVREYMQSCTLGIFAGLHVSGRVVRAVQGQGLSPEHCTQEEAELSMQLLRRHRGNLLCGGKHALPAADTCPNAVARAAVCITVATSDPHAEAHWSPLLCRE